MLVAKKGNKKKIIPSAQTTVYNVAGNVYKTFLVNKIS
jgi:hypothetical protein